MNNKQLEKLSNIFADLGKLIVAILILGQLVSSKGIETAKLIYGIIVSLTFFIVALLLEKGE